VEQLHTIAAVATPRGEGGISIIRISGSQALPILKKVFRPIKRNCRFSSRRLYLGHVLTEDGNRLDQVLAVYMRGPGTYTGEDVVEIHAHGGLFVTKEVLRLVLQAGATMAEPGEFTQRAFLSGKLDLVQAEAVIDLIRASASAAARQAERHLEGELSRLVRDIKQRVLQLLAEVVATVDFPDDDLPDVDISSMSAVLSQLETELQQLLSTSFAGKVLRDGIRVVIAGKPNVGKSSLLNALVGREKAIVTEYAGTTRDIVEELVVIGGVPVRLMDTAGLHAARDPVEQIGVDRAERAMAEADLLLVVLDNSSSLTEEDQRVLRLAAGRPHLIVLNKGDLEGCDHPELVLSRAQGVPLTVSAATGAGLGLLRSTIVQQVIGKQSLEESLLVANARQEQALRRAAEFLRDAKHTLDNGLPLDLVTVDLEEALRELGSVLGEAVDEAVIEDIFSRFCIGK
jgi:tRNA modification GTPase